MNILIINCSFKVASHALHFLKSNFKLTLPTNCLSQSDDHFLAGGGLCDPTDHALNSIDPHLQLHPGSISGGSGAAGL